jgi:hypothetical protein
LHVARYEDADFGTKGEKLAFGGGFTKSAKTKRFLGPRVLKELRQFMLKSAFNSPSTTKTRRVHIYTMTA